ncbi:sigma-70 family RNA polymerase sigma factor [Rudanella paleaurantiibacter]|uniref:Sigma-70 family RNA polymerase sigma factor n=1 Tax=Rudanella paleaurantiibacter TaxID=2614655 RepID=A0A7J5U315_9BACT|nr:sigma-70 family RNA polymerase sigma factor [Rudanella paleaurantiibacter]KAB7732090.1 sigma-70 family RNA polymerase sigma factor [Rudanella paleaurantiibacter]
MFLKRFRPFRSLSSRPQTDAEYVAAYRESGDLELLGELYERHMDLVYAVCFKYLRDEEESRDAVMQLFEQLIHDLRRHEVSNFKSWLHSVARNHCLMILRSRKTAVVEPADGLPPTDDDERTVQREPIQPSDDDDAFYLEENLTRMNECLQTLPLQQRQCIELFYLQEKSYVEVAELTGFDLKQVKSFLQNGRRNLKNCMSQ